MIEEIIPAATALQWVKAARDEHQCELDKCDERVKSLVDHHVKAINCVIKDTVNLRRIRFEYEYRLSNESMRLMLDEKMRLEIAKYLVSAGYEMTYNFCGILCFKCNDPV